MLDTTSAPASANFWFVGASDEDSGDQTPRFLAEGIWENGYDDKLLDQVRSMRAGERIAIKAAYTRKHGLPFDNRGHTVAVMGIKAIGIITENMNDGKRVKVDWTPLEPIREWYFNTQRTTIWRVQAGDWMRDALIAFAFEGQAQDIERFRNYSNWRERFGTLPPEKLRFEWTAFFEAVAEKLLGFADDRSALIAGMHEIASRIQGLGYLQDRFANGSTGPLQDICPFTVMGSFNRTMTDANRRLIAGELAKLLGVTAPVPTSFEGIPILNNQRSWFFAFAKERGPGDIDALWQVFTAAANLINDESDSDSAEKRDIFMQAYDAATKISGVAWNLSTGLYWAHPWEFPTLDSQSRQYLMQQLKLPISLSGPKNLCAAADYLKLRAELQARFEQDGYPVQSFPDLSLAAWQYKDPHAGSESADGDAVQADAVPAQDEAIGVMMPLPPPAPYGVDEIIKDGCFLAREEINLLLERLQSKKNLILQGPPGTGKTWLARRLAFALIGQKDARQLRAVQFHPNLSYEDFVRGWRPAGDGKLVLTDGVFMQAIRAARNDPQAPLVVVIEEINRGNPAQIFGELLTLLEASKRNPGEALELCYADADGVRRPVYVPENLYLIGTMNIADRSLALVDLALRRRFAFVGLEPKLGPVWREWVVRECGLEAALAADIEHRLNSLNAVIAADARLGQQFRIGHSYVTPVQRLAAGESKKWFRQVVETEITPLLEEYWFDAAEEAHKASRQLLQAW